MQIAEYGGGRRKIVTHGGSAHTEAELGVLLERAREMLADPAQGSFDLGIEPVAPRARLVTREAAPALSDAGSPGETPAAAGPARVVSTDSRVLFQVLDGVSVTWDSTSWAMRCSGTWSSPGSSSRPRF